MSTFRTSTGPTAATEYGLLDQAPGDLTAPATQSDSTLITALVTEMLADPGGSVTRGWLALRPADNEIETEIVVLSTFWPVRSMVLVRVGSVKLNGTLTPLAVNWPVPLANQYRLRWRNRPPDCW